eukprot:jgi/Ulvmu1/8477/UM044_0010.1
MTSLWSGHLAHTWHCLTSDVIFHAVPDRKLHQCAASNGLVGVASQRFIAAHRLPGELTHPMTYQCHLQFAAPVPSPRQNKNILDDPTVATIPSVHSTTDTTQPQYHSALRQTGLECTITHSCPLLSSTWITTFKRDTCAVQPITAAS